MEQIYFLEKIKVHKTSQRWGNMGYLQSYCNIKFAHITKDYFKNQAFKKLEHQEKIAISKNILMDLNEKNARFLVFNYLNHLGESGNSVFYIIPIELFLKVKNNSENIMNFDDKQIFLSMNDLKNFEHYTKDVNFVLDEMVKLNYRLKKEAKDVRN